MDSNYVSQGNERSSASWLILAVVALLVGGIVGYYLGTSGVGTGLVTDESAMEQDGGTNMEVDTETEVEEPANPFDDDGYRNPFE